MAIELDILVVGSRSYGAARRLVLGSTSNYLERHARCSLLVLPRPTTGGDGASRRLDGIRCKLPSNAPLRFARKRERGSNEMPADADCCQRCASDDERIKLVLADDHAVVRSGLRMLLDSESDFEVVAEASDVEAARRYVRGHHPHVLVLDLNMPGGSSLEAIPVIRAESPETQIVVLTMQQEPAFAREALGAGALGYVLKEAADDELVEAVRRAAVGESYLNPRLGARIASEPPPGPPDDLSEREVDVLG